MPWLLTLFEIVHEQYGSDIVSSVYLFNSSYVYLWIADAAAAKVRRKHIHSNQRG